MQENPVSVIDEKVKALKKELQQPRTVITPVITGTSGTYITFAHEFPKSLPIVSIKITQVFYIGLPPQPTVNIPIVLDTSSGTDMSIPYAQISDATMMNNMRTYATSAEIEITYA
jgi:hypothetical protein